MADLGKEIGWDDTIENEGADFEPLPEDGLILNTCGQKNCEVKEYEL